MQIKFLNLALVSDFCHEWARSLGLGLHDGNSFRLPWGTPVVVLKYRLLQSGSFAEYPDCEMCAAIVIG